MQYFSLDFWSTYADCILDRVALCQALADPKKSPELREMVMEVVNKETTALLHEHNDVIHMQREEITTLNLELKHLQKERFEILNNHAAAVQELHLKHASDRSEILSAHAAEIQALHLKYTEDFRNFCSKK